MDKWKNELPKEKKFLKLFMQSLSQKHGKAGTIQKSSCNFDCCYIVSYPI